MLCSLDDILQYNNPAVVARYQRENPEKAAQAELLFEDLMRFFWGTRQHALDQRREPQNPAFDFVYIMDADMRDIDQMWHVFLLYTRDYMAFCEKYFGEYLHHQPDLVPLFEKQGFQFEKNLEKFLYYSLALFGEEVIRRWFSATLGTGEKPGQVVEELAPTLA